MHVVGTWKQACGARCYRGGVGSHRPGWVRSGTLRAMSSFDAKAWLGADLGAASLPPKVQSWLQKAFDEGAWDENDIPAKDAVPSKAVLEMWHAILEDGAKMLSETVLKSHHSRMEMFLQPALAFAGEKE